MHVVLLRHVDVCGLALALVLPVACSTASAGGDTSGAGGTTDSTSSTGDGGGGWGDGGRGDDVTGTGAGGADSPPTCDASGPMEHHDCSGPCPIVLDVALRCTDYAFARHGVGVAPNAEAIMVTAASVFGPRIAMIDAGAIVALAHPFDDELVSMHPAAARDGQLAVATSDGPSSGNGRLVYATPDDGASLSIEVALEPSEGHVSAVALEYGPDGTPFLFHSVYPSYFVAKRESGAWSTAPIATTGEPYFKELTLSDDGEIIVVEAILGSADYEVRARVGEGVTTSLGTVAAWYPVFHAADPPTGDLPVDAGTVAVVAQSDTELVLLRDVVGSPQIALPVADTFVPQCWTGLGGPSECPLPACVETGTGVLDGAFAVARTTDGAVVVAYVVTHFDQTITYELDCAEEVTTECYCTGNVSTDASTAMLQVVRVDVDGSVDQLVELPIGRFTTDEIESTSSLAARAFGNDVAIAVRVFDSAGSPYVRVLRLGASG